MEQPVYIVISSTYYGPTLGYIRHEYNFSGDIFDILEDTICECRTLAADEYSGFRDNDDVPYDVLWESMFVASISLYKPSEDYIEWRGEI